MLCNVCIFLKFPFPTQQTEIFSYLKFSAVFGTTSARRVISMRPNGFPSAVISKKTTGLVILNWIHSLSSQNECVNGNAHSFSDKYRICYFVHHRQWKSSSSRQVCLGNLCKSDCLGVPHQAHKHTPARRSRSALMTCDSFVRWRIWPTQRFWPRERSDEGMESRGPLPNKQKIHGVYLLRIPLLKYLLVSFSGIFSSYVLIYSSSILLFLFFFHLSQ